MEKNEKLDDILKEYRELRETISDPELMKDSKKYREQMKRFSRISKIAEKINEFREMLKERDYLQKTTDDSDPELAEMAIEELTNIEDRIQKSEEELNMMLIPPDPFDDKNIIIEIRAGTGGEEAALFAGDLLRMYLKFAELKSWKTGFLSESPSGKGGFKEVILSVEGDSVYSKLKFESGVHRVQRVPETESSGRIHTSAVTVAVLPEADEIEIDINPEELKIDVYRSTGPGGQSVNTTDSAVRITHLPTGLVVTCQDEKSQHKNKAKAMKVLRARLLDLETQKQQDSIADKRRTLIGSGDRSEKIRTYNFPQNRVTDHRINLTLYKLGEILNGNVDELVDALNKFDKAEKLKYLKYTG
ncbi:MAG: peptide chain release factor 1 [bacterium]|nr:peptide chain release factor 1 [bacterium]